MLSPQALEKERLGNLQSADCVSSIDMMKRSPAALAVLVAIAAAISAIGSERPRWDQEEAVERVRAVIAQEKRGEFAWDKIAWHTDAERVAKLAENEGKPIFVYLYLKKDIGPKAAPC